MKTKIITLEVDYFFNDGKFTIYPVVLKSDMETILVDCGFPNSLDLIEEQLKEHNILLKDLTGLYLTHQDYDHMGNAFELKSKYPNIKIIASASEEPYISGKKKNLRLEQGEKLLESLPENEKQGGIEFCERVKKCLPVEVDEKVFDFDMLSSLFDCRILATKGHTSGHTSLYLPKQKTLILGDAAGIENSELVLLNPQYCLDLEEGKKTLEMLKKLDIKTYICYHSGVFKK